MRKIIIVALFSLYILKVQSLDAQLVYSVPVTATTHGHTDGITVEDSLLYVLTEHDCHILSYDCVNQTTEILEIRSFDESLFLRDLYLTEDWMYFSIGGNDRSIRRLSRNGINQELETVANNLFFPSALVATQDAVYYSDYNAIYKINSDGSSVAPELIIEDERLDLEAYKLTMLDSNIYASGIDVLFKINTSTDQVDTIPLPGFEVAPSLIPIGMNKLLGKSYDNLYIIDLMQNSFSFLGQIDCTVYYNTCSGSDLALIDKNLYITGSESPDVVVFKLPDTVFADNDGDKFGDPDSSLEIVGNNYLLNYVFDSTDCDDDNPSINQDAEDIPNNGVDENCDGIDLISSMHEIANTKINIYPNPSINVINIDCDGQVNFKVNLYDFKGTLINTFNNINLIPVSSLSSGAYLLEIIDLNSAQKVIERIIIGS